MHESQSARGLSNAGPFAGDSDAIPRGFVRAPPGPGGRGLQIGRKSFR